MTVLDLLSALALHLAPGAPFVQERGYGWGGDMHPMWWMWGAGGIVMMLGMVLFWGAVIVAIVAGVRWLVREGRDGRDAREPRHDPALQILRERYARGDISREEFEQRKRDLG